VSQGCQAFGCLPESGGFLDQEASLIDGIYLWRMLEYVSGLMDKEDEDTIMSSATLIYYQHVLDLGQDEAEALIAQFRRPTSEDREEED
jgi:hypothetical protein